MLRRPDVCTLGCAGRVVVQRFWLQLEREVSEELRMAPKARGPSSSEEDSRNEAEGVWTLNGRWWGFLGNSRSACLSLEHRAKLLLFSLLHS